MKQRREKYNEIVIDVGLRARRKLSRGMGDGKRRSLAGRSVTDSGGKPGARDGAGGGFAVGEREYGGVASLRGCGEEGRDRAEMQYRSDGA